MLVLVATLAGILTCRGSGVVTNCTDADLRAAMVGGGLVTFNCDGVLNLSSTLVITNDTTLDATGHDLTLGEGAVVQPFRLVQINPGATLVLNHLLLANGFARGTNSSVGNGYGGDGIGGAVWNNTGTLQATDCLFTNNQALGGTGGPGLNGTLALNFGGGGFGGAIYNDNGTLRLTNVTFAGNIAKGGQGGSAPSPAPSKGGAGGPSFGGAIYSRTGLVTIANCQFTSNSAPASVPGPANGYNPNSGFAAAGAGYFVAGTNMLTDSVFERQLVGGGQWFCDAAAGALYQAAGSLRISGCTFATNKVTGGDGIIIGSGSNAGSADGGAVQIIGRGTGEQGQVILYCDAVISNSCFAGNVAKGGLQGHAVGAAGIARGGAIAASSTLRMYNCTLAGNSSSGGDITYPSYPISLAYGGALYLNATSVLTHVTLASNTVSKGAGAGGSSAALGGGIYVINSKVYVRNSILSSNFPANCSGTLLDDGRSISSDGSCAFTAAGSLNNTDPRLGPLAAYGGLTLTMSLRSGSPAIDVGLAAYCLPTDQRGVPRPQGSGCDAGALEAAMLSIRQGSDGNWLISRGGVPGSSCLLQNSSNLTDWTDLQTVVADQTGQAVFAVPDEGAGGHYFRSSGVP